MRGCCPLRGWPILLAMALVACRDPEAAKSADPGPSAAKSATPGAPAPTPRPSLPATDPATGQPLPDIPRQQIGAAFEAETEDGAWAVPTEDKIKKRVAVAKDVHCRSSQCRLTLEGTEREVSAQLDGLELETSLRGIADAIILTAPEKRDGGKMAITVYARFTR